jgi:hypothetical protein
LFRKTVFLFSAGFADGAGGFWGTLGGRGFEDDDDDVDGRLEVSLVDDTLGDTPGGGFGGGIFGMLAEA